jgi:hypothetical protein
MMTSVTPTVGLAGAKAAVRPVLGGAAGAAAAAGSKPNAINTVPAVLAIVMTTSGRWSG